MGAAGRVWTPRATPISPEPGPPDRRGAAPALIITPATLPDRRALVRTADPTGRSHGPGVVVVVVIVVGLFDYDYDYDSVPGISVTASVLIAPRGRG